MSSIFTRNQLIRYRPFQMILGIGVAGLIVFKTNGLSFIYNPTIQKTIFAQIDLNPRRDDCFDINEKCIFGNGEPSLILIGDSHALSTVTALSQSIAHKQQSLLFYGYPNCLTMFGHPINNSSYYCNEFLDWVRGDIANNKLPVVIINSGAYPVGGAYMANPSSNIEPSPLIDFNDAPYDDYNQHYMSRKIETICEIGRSRQVYLVRPIPTMRDSIPNFMLKQHAKGEVSDYKITKANYLKANAVTISLQDAAAKMCGAKIIDITQSLCDQNFCYGTVDNVPIYADNNHLTERGSKLLVADFREQLNNL